MQFRTYFFFLATTAFLLFYPGEHPYFQLIAYHRDHFSKDNTTPPLHINPLPVVTSFETPLITAEGAYIVEVDSFMPILKKNERTLFYPASTTKILTALVTQDLFSPDDVITVGNPLAEGQTMGLVQGEQITMENLMYGILVHSGNDAADALAQEKGYRVFIDAMNTKAQELGMQDSRFTNPSGLHDSLQVTTPYDLSLAARALLQDPYLKKMVGTKEIVISDVNYTMFHTLRNVNVLLGEIQGLGGLKTGYTEESGQNLITFYRHLGHDYIIVVMKSDDRFVDTRTLVDWIIRSVSYQEVRF